MTRRASARASAVAAAPPERTFEVLTKADPTRFYPRFAVIPAVVAVRHQSGAWDGLGQTRTLVLADGGTLVETLEVVEAPTRFDYRLTRFTGLFGALVDHAVSEWRFAPAPTGTAVDWTYAFVGKRGRGLIVAAIVRLAWAPYMRRVLPALIAAAERRDD